MEDQLKATNNFSHSQDSQSAIEKNQAIKLDQALEKEGRSLTGFFIKNFRLTYLIVLAIVILGGYSLLTLPREADPEVKIPIAVVITVYPGATPIDIEELVTDKIEEKVKNLENLKQYSSKSSQGLSSVVVEFMAEADLKESYQKLRDAVDLAKPNLPAEAEDPIVTEIRVSDMPIIAFSLVCETEECQLKKSVDLIHDELESINGVSKVDKVGSQEREFQIIASQTKLAKFNISLGQLISAIARTNFNLPSGDIEIDGFKYNVRVKGKFKEISALNDIVIATYNDTPIYLRDLAVVKDHYKKRTTESRIGFAGQPSKDTVSLQVYKKTGGNIINIVEQSEKLINNLKQGDKLSPGLLIEKTSDNSWFIKDTLNRLGASGLQTMILIVFLLFIVLGLRGALITGLSVPIAFLMAFIFLYLQGATLNSIVLFSLVISLGLMVDNSIIIMEGINEYITKHHKTPLEAAILSVWNFKWAITAGTMTTVSAFLPMLLVSGVLGEYFAVIPKTISATLISSLFVALIVIPTLSSKFIKANNNNHNSDNGQSRKRVSKRYYFCVSYIDRLKIKYVKLMRYILISKKRSRLILVAVWLIFILAIAVPVSGMMKIEMFPAMDFDTFWVTIELPVGSVLDSTKQVAEEAERIIAQIPELKNYVTSLGTLMSFTESSTQGSHLATISVNLEAKKDRQRESIAIVAEVRPKLEALKGAKIEVAEASSGPPTGAPIEVRIIGSEIQQLAIIANQVVKILEEIPGTINVNDSLEDAAGEFTFTIDKQQANYYGLDIISIASTLRSAVYGSKASAVSINGEDVDIVVKYDKEKFTDVNDLENILIFTPSGQNIPIKQIASLSLGPSLLSIAHRDGEKIVTVTSQKEEQADLKEILAQFEEQKSSLNIPNNYSVAVGGELEDIAKSFRETFLSMIVGVILIAFILVLQFNSFKQPFIIITALPLAVIGVIIGLNILRMPFSFPAFLGIVALAGIAVNDAIVLIDRINKNLAMGIERIEGIIEAGQARMQPIFLTSLTTIAGIFPLVFADEVWQGFSIALISGLIFSTGLILIIVPILYAGITRQKKQRV